jgi:hypothetical protein
VEKKFKEVEDFLRNIGEGLISIDEKLGLLKSEIRLPLFVYFTFRVKPIMSESIVVNPPYIGGPA